MCDNMIKRLGIVQRLGIVTCSLCVISFPLFGAPQGGSLSVGGQVTKAPTGLLVASDTSSAGAATTGSQKKAKKGATDSRRKILTGETSYKNTRRGQKTSIDFDEATIDGSRKTPTGVAISKNRPDQEFDLINLRLSWHPEMKESTTRLETGKGK